MTILPFIRQRAIADTVQYDGQRPSSAGGERLGTPIGAGRVRPASAGRFRPSSNELQVVQPRRPITPQSAREPHSTSFVHNYGDAGGGGVRDSWDRPNSARSRDRDRFEISPTFFASKFVLATGSVFDVNVFPFYVQDGRNKE